MRVEEGVKRTAPVLHSLKYFITASTGTPIGSLSEVVLTAEVDELLTVYCDNKRLDVKDIVKSFFTENPERLDMYKQRCFHFFPNFFKSFTNDLMRLYNQSGGVHVVQMVSGCEWDDETGEVKGFSQYGYDGEDFMKWDPNTFTWIALRPEAVPAKLRWDADKDMIERFKTTLLTFPKRLKEYVDYGRSVLLRTELPSVSLLQKTPSSPVSCLATGFYPHRASLVWRKDGEELHEEVDHGEILPNHDGTFQMSVDLNHSVTPEDWTRYDCVFQLSGVNEDIITKLEKDRIRTNW
ncbi:major histocompatibility complex class I-related gene protein-like, partial [Sparus aurata]|uniref:major histocompatibility complex class I-related gene protein-like n=1 Tax=Sparus aurata TaxID=8175 RepID=UPI0011C0D76A